jgi:protoporphyrinogen oxidase
MKVIVSGAGPAGLTAAYELTKNGQEVIVIEKDPQVGGIAKTINYKGYLFDQGGHRFFTKYPEVQKIWQEVLPDDFLLRPRLSRIYYRGKFFYYPIKPFNALWNLGPLTAISSVFSYFKARLQPYPNPTSFEEWVVNQFGRQLFEIFFKTYTEKVWGIPCQQISADWAAQRIQGLSLITAVLNAFGLTGKQKVRTLIDEFQYPRRGPGQFWEKMAELIESQGGKVELRTKSLEINLSGEDKVKVKVETNGQIEEIKGDALISTAPLSELILSLRPVPPDEVVTSARNLSYRDFITIGVILNKDNIFPDNWIYIHSPEIKAGRLQNFKNWNPEMVPDPATTSLGLEYFCFDSDPIWSQPQNGLADMAIEDLTKLHFAEAKDLIDAVVIKVPKAYPVYSPNYQARVKVVRDYLNTLPLIQTIGRNGLHRYNNMDHSMLSGIYAARNLLGEHLSPWDINVEEEYHETA